MRRKSWRLAEWKAKRTRSNGSVYFVDRRLTFYFAERWSWTFGLSAMASDEYPYTYYSLGVGVCHITLEREEYA